MKKRLWLILMVFMVTAMPAPFPQVQAVEPDEILKDPKLEARARKISLELRCLVCKNQSIDDSNASLAKDLRVLVRERLTSGETDSQVIDYIVSKYGEFVLLRPRFNSRTYLLWFSPVIFILLGLFFIWRMFSSNQGKQLKTSTALSTEEEDKIKKLMEQES
ncbi:MAG: cytochrome c-type biogenesis protein [Methyloligellaceae bacterium]